MLPLVCVVSGPERSAYTRTALGKIERRRDLIGEGRKRRGAALRVGACATAKKGSADQRIPIADIYILSEGRMNTERHAALYGRWVFFSPLVDCCSGIIPGSSLSLLSYQIARGFFAYSIIAPYLCREYLQTSIWSR